MRNRWIAAVMALLMGCAKTSPRREVPASTYRLTPPLAPGVSLQVYVEDIRPGVETEKNPSTEFLYSGALFDVEANTKTVADALGQIAIKFGGASKANVSTTNPRSGPAIVFKLEHWYSRTPIKPVKPPVVVNAQFSGVISLQRDGNIVATRRVTVTGRPSVVDMYIISEREKAETPRLVAKAMEQTANSAEQNGYREIAKFLQESWSSFQQNR